jgi:hypothetical protein
MSWGWMRNSATGPANVTFERLSRLLFSLCLGLTLISQPTYAQTPSAVSTTDRRHPFVEHAEGRYKQYLASESQGDAAAYKGVRTRQAYERVVDQLKGMGKSESDLGPMLKRAASVQTDVSQLTFVRCDGKTRVARLLYQREGGGPKGPTLEFAVFMVHWENGAWRIGWIGHSIGKPTRANGEQRTADELLHEPRFALD